jgi:hypothetical protein
MHTRLSDPEVITTIRISTLGELIDRVTPTEPDPATGRLRDYGVYRGASNADAPMLTALDRLGGINSPHSKAHVEEHILRNFIRYSRAHLPHPPANEWELLIAAQHHGLPTRLMDWSYSPLVAAHFATSARSQTDRVIWRLDWKKIHRAFDLPELAFLIEDLDRIFGEDGSFTPWKLFAQESRSFACLIDPPSLDARIVAQSGAFTLCSEKDISFDRFLTDHHLQSALTRFVIPYAENRRFRDQLDLVGSSERHLFPDLDGVAAELKRYYS